MKSYAEDIKSFDFLLIDGYNVIYSWPSLIELANISLEAARDGLVAMLSNYQGFKGLNIIIVFDAYKIRFGKRNIEIVGNVSVVYTSEFETADAYIEKVTGHIIKIAWMYKVAVATGDYTEQVIIMSKGALRLSPRELLEDVELAQKAIRAKIEKDRAVKNNTLFDNLDEATAKIFETMRKNKNL